MRLLSVLCLSFITAFLLAVPAKSASVRAITFEELLSWSDLVIRVEPIEKKSEWMTLKTEDGTSHMIYTIYSFRVSDDLYGRRDGNGVRLVMRGGEVNGEILESGGSFSLDIGKEYILHLRWDELNDIYHSAATAQSVFVVEDTDDGAILINLNDHLRGYEEQARSNRQSAISFDDLVRPREPQVIELEALRQLYGEAE